MKIIALLATPHGLKGNTAALLRHVINGAEKEGGAAEVIVLRGDTVLPCLGCDQCHIKGYCIQKDEFETIKEKIIHADGLILAGPNYIFNVSAQLKAFLDRCCGVVHCMSFWGKYGASVVTSGGGDEEPIAKYMNHFLITAGVTPIGAVWANMSEMEGDDFSAVPAEKARNLGKRLVEAWKKGEVPPEASEQRRIFHERMKSLISWRASEWPYEYKYWKEKYGL
jgi:multimeric flavodoxin WrbA